VASTGGTFGDVFLKNCFEVGCMVHRAEGASSRTIAIFGAVGGENYTL